LEKETVTVIGRDSDECCGGSGGSSCSGEFGERARILRWFGVRKDEREA
jgi:hypothetical protein